MSYSDTANIAKSILYNTRIFNFVVFESYFKIVDALLPIRRFDGLKKISLTSRCRKNYPPPPPLLSHPIFLRGVREIKSDGSATSSAIFFLKQTAAYDC